MTLTVARGVWRQRAAGKQAPADCPGSQELGAMAHLEGLIMALRPWLDERPSYGPRHEVSHLDRIVLIAVTVAMAGFLTALITGILTAGS